MVFKRDRKPSRSKSKERDSSGQPKRRLSKEKKSSKSRERRQQVAQVAAPSVSSKQTVTTKKVSEYYGPRLLNADLHEFREEQPDGVNINL